MNRNLNRVDGPPPFVPFGQKMKKEQVDQLSGKFRSLDIAGGKESKTEEQNSEFSDLRKTEIAQALKEKAGTGGAQKKTYGGIKQVTVFSKTFTLN